MFFVIVLGVSSIFPQKVDVTKNEDTLAAATNVQKWLDSSSAKNPRYLHAVVNNAGIGIGGLIDWMDVSVFQKVMDGEINILKSQNVVYFLLLCVSSIQQILINFVSKTNTKVNYFGTIRTVKSFLPILKAQACSHLHDNARIVNMVSMAGLVSNAGISSYYGSKHAQEAFTSCLRMELKSFDIDVVTVNPSVHETPMNDGLGKQISGIWENLSSELKEEYGMGKYT